ncbi:MAG: HNH endonuclease [bacterium]|nr:HNH endonuclease [bacterium]
MHAAPLSRRVLVLNRLWQPVHICGARRALALVCKGAAHVVSADDGSFETCDLVAWTAALPLPADGDGIVRTVSMAIRVPEIILLLHYDRLPPQEVKLTRKNIYLRDGNTCQYCGRSLGERDLNLDHILPRRLGGTTTWTNVVCSCVPCNLRKGEKTLRAARMDLLRPPRKPRWSPFSRIAFRRDGYASWDHFLDPSRCSVQLSGRYA